MSQPRFFVILAGDEDHLALDHVARKHGSLIQNDEGHHSAVLFESPCKRLVYGAVEFTPHPPKEKS